jgi:hypothetical protein
MTSELREQAETRLTRAAHALGLADPRPALRARLKRLRETHPDAFSRAIRHYEENVLTGLIRDDPLNAWLEYARFLGELTSAGRLTSVDATGRAATFRSPPQTGDLVLFLPEDPATDVLVAVAPLVPSAAQQATLDLLVARRLGLAEPDRAAGGGA